MCTTVTEKFNCVILMVVVPYLMEKQKQMSFSELKALKLAIIERQTRTWPNDTTNTKPNLKQKSNSPPKKEDSNNGFL